MSLGQWLGWIIDVVGNARNTVRPRHIARFGGATRDFETPHDLYATAHDLEVTMHGLKTLLDSETTTHDLEPL